MTTCECIRLETALKRMGGVSEQEFWFLVYEGLLAGWPT